MVSAGGRGRLGPDYSTLVHSGKGDGFDSSAEENHWRVWVGEQHNLSCVFEKNTLVAVGRMDCRGLGLIFL